MAQDTPNPGMRFKWIPIVSGLIFMLSPTIGWLTDTLWLTLFGGILLIPTLEWAWHDHSRSPSPLWHWPRGFLELTALSVVAQTIGLCVIAGEMMAIDAITIGLSMGYVAGGTGMKH